MLRLYTICLYFFSFTVWLTGQELYSEVYGTLFLSRFQKIDFNVLLCFIDQRVTK
jgi:hypothetical protein